MTTLVAVPPLDLGQLVTIRSRDEQLPGTVVGLSPLDGARWAVRVEVLASFGVGTSHHIVDGDGRETDLRSNRLTLECTDAESVPQLV